MSEKSDFHVDILTFPRGESQISTWGKKNSSEESNETSEKMNHAHVENKKYPRGDLRFSTWIFDKGENRTNFPVKICKDARGEDSKNSELTHYIIMTSSIPSLVADV